MWFVLHHSTGTLMLTAENRQDVEAWSLRQLGPKARHASVQEWTEEVAGAGIERDGTGIKAGNCQPHLSVMADSVQRVTAMENENHSHVHWSQPSPFRCQAALVH